MLLVGNDIVDFHKAGYPDKHKDSRFVSRVFTEQEKSAIFESHDPDLTLWMFWAAKETAYKLISKLTAPPVFAHKQFGARLREFTKLEDKTVQAEAQLVYGDQVLKIDISANGERVHALGSFGDSADYSICSNVKKVSTGELEKWRKCELLESHFTEGERTSIHHAESALVRFYCKAEIAKKLGIEPRRLQIIRPIENNKSQPPFLLLDNQRTDIDVSFSHHGQWLAWVYSVPRNRL